MAEYETTQNSTAGSRAAVIDEGLRAHMNKVYGLMSLALLVTAAIAVAVGTSNYALTLIFGTPLFYAVMFGPLALVLVLNFSFHRLPVVLLNGIFWGYAALTGASMASIFIFFDLPDIFVALGSTAVAFLGLSMFGYTTKRDLGPIGAFLIMGAWGLVAVSIGAFFMGGLGDTFYMTLNVLTIIIFSGLTAYYTQDIKTTYIQVRTHGGPEAEAYLEKAAIVGALSLYVSFIAIFRSLLALMNND